MFGCTIAGKGEKLTGNFCWEKKANNVSIPTILLLGKGKIVFTDEKQKVG